MASYRAHSHKTVYDVLRWLFRQRPTAPPPYRAADSQSMSFSHCDRTASDSGSGLSMQPLAHRKFGLFLSCNVCSPVRFVPHHSEKLEGVAFSWHCALLARYATDANACAEVVLSITRYGSHAIAIGHRRRDCPGPYLCQAKSMPFAQASCYQAVTVRHSR